MKNSTTQYMFLCYIALTKQNKLLIHSQSNAQLVGISGSTALLCCIIQLTEIKIINNKQSNHKDNEQAKREHKYPVYFS